MATPAAAVVQLNPMVNVVTISTFRDAPIIAFFDSGTTGKPIRAGSTHLFQGTYPSPSSTSYGSNDPAGPTAPINTPGHSALSPLASQPSAVSANFYRWLGTLPTYNGIGDPTSFVDRYRMLAALPNVSERDRHSGLMVKLTDHAASWLYRLPAHQASSSESILEQLQLQFQESKAVRMDRLGDMEFQASDNLPAYIRSYARLALTIPNTTGEDQAHKFVASLNSELRKHIRVASQTKTLSSLQEAFIIARNIASVLLYDLSDEPETRLRTKPSPMV